MRLTLCPACAGKFKDKTQKTIHQVPDKCQGGCRNRAMCLVWDVSVYNRGDVVELCDKLGLEVDNNPDYDAAIKSMEVFMPDDVEVENDR